MFSKQRNWMKIETVYFKSQRFCWIINRFLVELVASVINARLFLCNDMEDEMWRNGKFRSFIFLRWDFFWYWRNHFSVFRSHLSLISCWSWVSISLNCCINWLRSSSCFREICFVASLMFYSYTFISSLHLFWWKNFREVLLQSYRWILYLSSKNLRK